MQEQIATGRRKRAVASVRIREGKGSVDINGRPFELYFPSKIQRNRIIAPLERTSHHVSMDIIVRVRGGGLAAQAEAIRLGLARAIVQEEGALKHSLKEAGFLTRDSRRREREKYGHAGARKRFQYSKR